MQNKALILKQFADKLDVSKSYIDKIIYKLGMHTELEKDGNRYIVNPNQQRKIEQFLDSKKSLNEHILNQILVCILMRVQKLNSLF